MPSRLFRHDREGPDQPIIAPSNIDLERVNGIRGFPRKQLCNKLPPKEVVSRNWIQLWGMEIQAK
jgi:hypothetical protein